MTNEKAIKYLKQLYPNGGHCWLDEQRIEAIGMAIKALQKEPVSEDLEEAVNAYIGYAPEVDESSSTYGKRQAFKAGANWQEQKDESYTKSMYKVGINTGKELMKQQLMTKAVDVTIAIPYQNGYGGYTQLVDSKEGLHFGENLKVLVIKKEIEL